MKGMKKGTLVKVQEGYGPAIWKEAGKHCYGVRLGTMDRERMGVVLDFCEVSQEYKLLIGELVGWVTELFLEKATEDDDEGTIPGPERTQETV